MSVTIPFKRQRVFFDNLMDKNYQNYLESEDWKEKVREKAEEFDNICQLCFNNVRGRGGGQLHHINYNSLFNEQEQDLIFICNECHLETHNLNNKPELTEQPDGLIT